MKNRISFFIVVQIITLLIFTATLHAWTGNTWGPISRETIIRIADEMVDFSWTPKNTISNHTSNDYPWITYNTGTVYYGEAYCLFNDPAQNWSDFYGAVNGTPAGSTSYGNECSSFVSMAWKLPERYNTSAFECDAINSTSVCGSYNPSTDNYVTKLGEKSTGNKIEGLLPGDALVKTGHIILFESYLYDAIGNKTGIKAMEQTPSPPSNSARRSSFTWAGLSSYRPIRRNKIDEGNYVFKTKWGSQGTGNGQFNYPFGITVDSSGNVYVADRSNNRIQKFNSNGGFITKWGSKGSDNGRFYYPYSITVDTSGNVYVADRGVDPYGPTPGCGSANERIQKFNSNGSFITKWGRSCVLGWDSPLNLATDSSGNVYETDFVNDEVRKYDGNGGFITKWGSNGSDNGRFYWPWGIAIDLFGNVYVADSENDRIQKFNSNGGFITKWGSCCSGDGYFNKPTGIAVDPSVNVYVVDTSNHRIQKFDSNGNFITKWGSYSAWEDGKFQYPYGVAVDSSLNVYVADTWNHHIQKFAPVSPYPSAPSNLAVTAASSTQNNLSWTDNSNNESGFKIKRKTGVNGTYSTIATVGANVTSFSNTGLTPGVTYYYAVWAHNNYGDSAYSNEAVAKAPPKPLVKANGSENNISIPSSTQLNITISLNPGGYLNTNADWWVIGIIKGTTNIWYYYNSLKQWTTTPSPYYQGPLYNLSSLNVFSGILSPGNYDYHFGVDFSVNGVLDANPLFYDSISVTVY